VTPARGPHDLPRYTLYALYSLDTLQRCRGSVAALFQLCCSSVTDLLQGSCSAYTLYTHSLYPRGSRLPNLGAGEPNLAGAGVGPRHIAPAPWLLAKSDSCILWYETVVTRW
jgi:hypothetical protein